MYQAAGFVGKTDELSGSSVKPQYITVSGSVADKTVYSGYQYYGSTPNNLLSAIKAPKFGVDVSQNITETGNYNNPNSKLGSGVVFGSGNTPATVNDYKLAGDTIMGCTCSYANKSTYNSDGSTSALIYDYTITNNNDAEITIGEIGIFFETYWKHSNTDNRHYFNMIERTALETPITIPAGGVGQVTYTIRMDYPVT
jgi:hypothetical protein